MGLTGQRADLLPSPGVNAQLARDTIELKSTRGIPSKACNLMVVPLLEELAGWPPGSYAREPEAVYRDSLLAWGACSCDQWIPRNPLTMAEAGFAAGAQRGSTTGAEVIVVDGVAIDSAEAVVEHLERTAFPRLEQAAAAIDLADEAGVAAAAAELVRREAETQAFFGPDLLKVPYGGGFQAIPTLAYQTYGYQHYFTAYGLYPDVLERHFALQADLGVKVHTVAARAYREGGLPPVLRLDHDMCDSRGPLVSLRSLERRWFPHFARSLAPLLAAGIQLLWHCDGNVMPMVPGLLACGVTGFQGFQYEDGVDYVRLCRMTGRDGAPLAIWAGVSVSTTLPHGTREDVRRELAWLVEHGPRVGLFLGASSSIAPGTNPENVRTFLEGLRHYRERGRS
jgi:hypothetical protein